MFLGNCEQELLSKRLFSQAVKILINKFKSPNRKGSHIEVFFLYVFIILYISMVYYISKKTSVLQQLGDVWRFILLSIQK